MKKIPLNEMQQIQGGGLRAMCFGLGLITVVSLHHPFTLFVAAPAIKYYWNH